MAQQTNHKFADAAWAKMFSIPPPPTQDPPMMAYRGATLGQPFDMSRRMRDSVEKGKPMIGFWMGQFPEVSVARVVGQVGFDFVFVDWEHTPFGPEKLGEIVKTIQYAGEGNTAVIVRVPSHDHYYIAWALDSGASAVVLPHTETAEQAKAAVDAAKFPPLGGSRSGPPNAMVWGFNDAGPVEGGGMVSAFNKAAIIMQIESQKGVDNADAIAAVEGVDGLMLGPGDLIFDMGIDFSTSHQNPAFIKNAAAVAQAAKKHNKASLCPSFTPKIDWIFQMGYTMTACANDGLAFASALRGSLNAAYEHMNDWKAQQEGKLEKGENAGSAPGGV